MEKPVISVIIPVYNGAGYIKQAIDSVFAQNISLELLVIDDCSTDRTPEIISMYKNRPDFFYFRNAKNLGPADSRNRGVLLARGRYIAFLDADDWWANGKLAAQLKAMARTKAVLCSTGRELMLPDGRSAKKYFPVKSRISYQELLKHNSINCSSVLVTREAALRFPMEHDRDSHEDYLTWLKILKCYGPAVGINRPFLKYRLSEGGKSRNKRKSALMTYRVYRYMGFGFFKSLLCFFSCAIHGLWKYR